MDTIVNQQLAADGEHMDYIIQLISVRESIDTKTNTKEIKKIPFRYESVGIIKIVSILPFLIEAYTNTESVVLIDELDSGIYEYLLGELVAIFEQGAFGQLIFTSHNLRVLEMLPQEKIVFQRRMNLTAIPILKKFVILTTYGRSIYVILNLKKGSITHQRNVPR